MKIHFVTLTLAVAASLSPAYAKQGQVDPCGLTARGASLDARAREGMAVAEMNR